MLKIAQRKSDGRLLQVMSTKGNKVRVRALNSSNPEWVEKRSIGFLPKPEKGVHLRLTKEVGFDQECGCTAVVEVKNGRIETFNVYGNLEKYLESGIRKGNSSSPHYRRCFLRDNGFVRSKGIIQKTKTEDQLAKLRKFERTGYKVLA